MGGCVWEGGLAGRGVIRDGSGRLWGLGPPNFNMKSVRILNVSVYKKV